MNLSVLTKLPWLGGNGERGGGSFRSSCGDGGQGMAGVGLGFSTVAYAGGGLGVLDACMVENMWQRLISNPASKLHGSGNLD